MLGRLKNRDYAKLRGRDKRLDAELAAHKNGVHVPYTPPFFSHCANLQSHFERGWNSVTACDIRIHLDKSLAPSGVDQLSKLRSLRQCHSL